MRSTALILFLLTMISACGKPATSSTRKERTLNPGMMESLIANQTIYCSDSEFCPEGVARMFAINFDDNKRSSMCSAFLIAEDLVMTNSHCVWAGDISLKQTCEGLYFAFPTPHGQTQTALCSKIMWRDPRQNGRDTYRKGDNDFALIRLNQKVSVKPLKLSSTLSVGQKVFPLVTDHIDGFMAQMTKLECEVESIDRLGVTILKDCPVISGNSGSAVLDENKNVVAVIFASTDPHIRKPTDQLVIRTKSSTRGLAFTISHIKRILGAELNRLSLE